MPHKGTVRFQHFIKISEKCLTESLRRRYTKMCVMPKKNKKKLSRCGSGILNQTAQEHFFSHFWKYHSSFRRRTSSKNSQDPESHNGSSPTEACRVFSRLLIETITLYYNRLEGNMKQDVQHLMSRYTSEQFLLALCTKQYIKI